MSNSFLGPAAEQFNVARDAYRDARNEQRKIIVEVLKTAGFKVKARGNAGRGLGNYTSGGRLAPPFDLSNWMWVEGQRDDIFVVVSLQVLDQDPKSMNIHALIDRIGVDVFRESDAVDDDDPLFERTTTPLQLPLSDETITQFIALVEQKILDLK